MPQTLWNIGMSTEKMSTENPQFEVFFKKPEYDDRVSAPVNLAIAMGAMASRLAREERTRTHHPDGRSENVAEHALMLVKVATRLAREYYPHLDSGLIAVLSADHDDVEAYVGDTATDRISDSERHAKHEREAHGLSLLQQEYVDISPSYVNDVTSYELQETAEAEFVKIVDKWMVLLIHIPNEGKTIVENYTYEEYLQRTYAESVRLHAAFKRFPELIDGRTELALYLGRRYYLGE
jgi:5'-deoxynucleotidase YfbR-like HD superfamily hydrolase